MKRLIRSALRGTASAGARDDRIFISLASYRDPELPLTISSALENAARPERLRFGICFQYDEQLRRDLDPWADDDRVRVDAVGYLDARGTGWARSRAGRLYEGEGYVLQVDSHSRFAQDWDARLIEMLESIGHAKPLLTAYPHGYRLQPDGTEWLSDEQGIQRVGLAKINDDLTTHQICEHAPDLSAPGKSRLLAAGFVFTHGSFLREAPMDPEIYFQGEEVSLAIRAYTHGYNLYYPTENLVWHNYDRDDAPRHWDDHADHTALHAHAVSRLHALLVGDPSVLGEYGLGTARTRADFESYASIDFERGIDPTRPIRYLTELELDTSRVPQRDDYAVWVFALLTDDDTEIHRQDIHDPDVLNGLNRTITVDAQLPEEPTKYILWPKINAGEWGTRQVIPLRRQRV